MPTMGESYDLKNLTTEEIKQNTFGKIIEQDSPFYYTNEKQANPAEVEERVYHAFTRDFLTNEIFRRVEPSGMTMAEYMLLKFPSISVYNGIQD